MEILSAPNQTPVPETGRILSHAFEIYKKMILYVLIYALLAAGLYSLVSFLLPGGSGQYREIIDAVGNGETIDMEALQRAQENMDTGAKVLSFFSSAIIGALLYPLNAGVVYIAHKINTNRPVAMGDLFIGFRRNTANLIVYGLIVSILATIGTFLCILPGAYVYVVSFIGLPILLFENKPAVEALKKSFDLSHKNFGLVLGTVLLSYLISVSGLLLCCIGVLITMGFNMAAKYSLYCALNGTPQNFQSSNNQI